MILIKVLHVISGNDDGGGGVHVLNTLKKKIEGLTLELCLIGDGGLVSRAQKENYLFKKVENKINNIELVDFINDNNYDLVNFHGARASLIHKVIRKKINAKTVLTVHSNFNKDFDNKVGIKRLMSTFLFKSSIKSFKHFIVVSDYLEDLLKSEGISGSAYKVYNGVDFKSLQSSGALIAKEKSLEDVFVFGSIARFHPIKNHKNMIKAFHRLIQDGANARLVLIGSGSGEDEIRRLINDLSLDKHVELLGYKEDAFRYLPSFDVNVLTSFNEGGIPPLAVLEGFVFEKTVVLSNINGVKGIIGELAYYLDPKEVDSIFKAMKNAYEDKKIDIKGSKCRELVGNDFSIDKFCERYYKAYKDLLVGGSNEE